jgi:hypothetical protein
LDSLVTFLLHKRIFNKQMIDSILSLETESERNERLLMDLCRRGPEAFDKFVDALVETGQYESAQLLQPSNQIKRTGSFPHNSKSVLVNNRCNDNRIKVSPAITWAQFDNCYQMQSLLRGYCLIINNVSFDNNIFEERLGSDADAKRLDEVFQELGFKVYLKRNKTKEEMFKLCDQMVIQINNYQTTNMKPMDAFVLIILSHGTENAVYSTDGGVVDIFDLIEKFNNENCIGLRGSPKMVFIQACRGSKRDFGVRIDEEKEEQGFDFNIKKELQNKKELSDYKIECFTTSDANKLVGDLQIKSSATESINIVNPVVKTASWQDIIISYPTVFGYVAYRNPEMGSWYCSALVTVLADHASDLCLIDILRMVETEIRSMQSPDGDKQSTSITLIGWNKKLFFNPGLYKN